MPAKWNIFGGIQREMQQADERRATNDETGQSGELVMEPEWKAAEASYDTVRADLTIMDIFTRQNATE